MTAAIDRLRGLPGHKGGPDRFTVKCPAHDDKENSLSVTMADGGRVLLHCHAGCATPDVLAALDLRTRDLFPSNGNGKTDRKRKKQFDTAYDYRDADGNLTFQVVRWKPKSFTQRRPDPQKSGGWLWNLGGIERPLYRLPELLKARAEGRAVFLCEGEKDADAVAALGLCATTNAGGCAKWSDSDAAALAGARVVVLADNDGPGIAGAWKRADSIEGAAVLLLPDLPPKGDISDWLAQGGTREQLERLAREALANPPARPEAAPAAEVVETGPDPLSELANAYRFRAQVKGCIMNDPGLGWLYFRGGHWQPGEREGTKQAAAIGADVRAEAYSKTDDPNVIKSYYSAARHAESARGVEATLKLAKVLPGIDATGIDWDKDEWLVNCTNGTVDVRTLTLMPHEKSDYITRCVPLPYDPAATCPIWEEHLDRVFARDRDLIRYVQFLFGYSVTASMRHQLFVICHGEAGRGKSTTIEAAMRALGPYADAVSHDVVLDQSHQGHACTLAALRGLRFGLVSELPEGARWNEAQVKRLATGDTLAARLIGQNPFSFKSTMKLWVNCNARPEFRDSGGGMARRIRCVPFEVDLTGPDRDRDIEAKLQGEASGILRWIIEGAQMAFEGEPDIPDAVRAASREYVRQNDLLQNFLDECCVLSENEQAEKGATYETFRKWGGGNLSMRKLGQLLAPKFDEYRGTGGTRYWIGFRLK